MKLFKELQEKIQAAEEAAEFAEAKIKNSPAGRLVIKKIKGKDRFYLRNPEADRLEVYLGTDNQALIKQLQEKEYYEKLKKVSKKEITELKRIQSIENRLHSFEEVYFDLPVNRKDLVEPYKPIKDEEIRKKIEKECKELDKEVFYRKGVSKKLQFVTLNGERVRSKSELIIADRLKAAGIHYYYEAKYVFQNKETCDFEVWFPDFQMFNSRTGERFFWEHFGLMDNAEYLASCQYKLETYAKYGIIMGKNLIVTMESTNHSLNVAYVNRLIEEFLK